MQKKKTEEQERGNQEREPELNGETETIDEAVRVEGPGHREEKGWRAGCGKLERRWEAGVGKGEEAGSCLALEDVLREPQPQASGSGGTRPSGEGGDKQEVAFPH